MKYCDIYGLTAQQKITLINLLGAIIFDRSTKKDCIAKIIDLIKNESERYKWNHIIDALIDNDLLAKDSKDE